MSFLKPQGSGRTHKAPNANIRLPFDEPAVSIRMLILEDSEDDAELMLRALRRDGYDPVAQRVESEADYLASLEADIQIILADYSLPGFNAPRALGILRQRGLNIPFIVVSGAISEEIAVECMKQGATDYLLKDRLARLGQAVSQALEQKRLRDVSREADRALRDSERRFRALIENSPSGVVLMAPDGRVLYSSPAMGRILGHSELELVGQPLHSQVHPDDLTSVREVFVEVLRRPGESVSIAFRAQCVDRSWRWLEGTAMNLLADPGVGAIVLNYGDVTERRWAEEEVQRRNAELRTLNATISAVTRSLELSELFSALKSLLEDQSDAGAIYSYEESSDRLHLQASWSLDPDEEQRLKSVQTAGFRSEAAIRQREVLDCSHSIEPNSHWAPGHNASCLAVPIVSGDKVQGLIELMGRAPVTLSEDRIALFRAIGQQVGVAVFNARLFDQVVTGRQRLQVLSRRLVEVQEAERQHLARELHDEVGQLLTGLKLRLEMSGRLPIEEIPASLGEARALVTETMGCVRRLSLDLRPSALDDLGLLPALLWHFERYTGLTGVQVAFRQTGLEGRRFSPEVEIGAYRIVQEALTNVARHAGVSEVTVRVWMNPAFLSIQVEDEGAGFDPEAVQASSSSGLTGMRERAMLLGGRFSVESRRDGGARLTAELPVECPDTRLERRSWRRA